VNSPPMNITFLWPDVCRIILKYFDIFWTKIVFLGSKGRMG
jgi:hypothetical protein